MSEDKAQERISTLEASLKAMQDNYNHATQVMKNCEVQIIQIQAAIAERKLDLSKHSKVKEKNVSS